MNWTPFTPDTTPEVGQEVLVHIPGCKAQNPEIKNISDAEIIHARYQGKTPQGVYCFGLFYGTDEVLTTSSNLHWTPAEMPIDIRSEQEKAVETLAREIYIRMQVPEKFTYQKSLSNAELAYLAAHAFYKDNLNPIHTK